MPEALIHPYQIFCVFSSFKAKLIVCAANLENGEVKGKGGEADILAPIEVGISSEGRGIVGRETSIASWAYEIETEEIFNRDTELNSAYSRDSPGVFSISRPCSSIMASSSVVSITSLWPSPSAAPIPLLLLPDTRRMPPVPPCGPDRGGLAHRSLP